MKNLVGGDENGERRRRRRRRVEANGKGDGRRVGGVQLEPGELGPYLFIAIVTVQDFISVLEEPPQRVGLWYTYIRNR